MALQHKDGILSVNKEIMNIYGTHDLSILLLQCNLSQGNVDVEQAFLGSFVNSVRSSNSHPDLLLIHPPPPPANFLSDPSPIIGNACQ